MIGSILMAARTSIPPHCGTAVKVRQSLTPGRRRAARPRGAPPRGLGPPAGPCLLPCACCLLRGPMPRRRLPSRLRALLIAALALELGAIAGFLAYRRVGG